MEIITLLLTCLTSAVLTCQLFLYIQNKKSNQEQAIAANKLQLSAASLAETVNAELKDLTAQVFSLQEKATKLTNEIAHMKLGRKQ